MKESQKTKVTLMSWTKPLMETIYCEWQASRTEGGVPSPDEVHALVKAERFANIYGTSSEQFKTEFKGETPELTPKGEEYVSKLGARPKSGPLESEVRKVFEDCVAMKVPIAETVGFVFLVEHMPISMREQWVRHRIGHKYNFDFGFENLPNQHDSSFWSETFRAKDLSKFAAEGEFLEPEWLDLHGGAVMPGYAGASCPNCGELGEHIFGPEGIYKCLNQHEWKPDPQRTIRHFWREQHAWIAAAYTRMLKAGMPPEDARNLLPLGIQHRMTWSTNLSALTHLLSKRGCWIAQLGMWEPVILGVVDELATKVDPFFRTLINPPCIGSNGEFEQCRFHKENKEYILGNDPHHPCPLWMWHHGEIAKEVALHPETRETWMPDRADDAMLEDKDGRQWAPVRPHVTGDLQTERRDFKRRADKYSQLWGRSPTTGERIQLT